ncbi:unnamed protein product [Adineta steineri]|uniref:Uncharacterized protein n=1 Tax=Adineta steineri TaxID=433720 RepID=A0A814V173_9BILA|nr:unnamed protein product [Adineta steineri]CAF1182640.1 unnamed protein product [Adineta steineri]
MGCSSSNSQLLVIVPNSEQIDGRKVLLLKSADLPPRRFVENCVILLVNDGSSTDIVQVRAQLWKTVYTTRIFTDFEECHTFMKKTEDEKLFLIVSEATNRFVENVRHLPQLEKIYVFDLVTRKIVEKEEQTNIFRDSTLLCQQLQHDIELCELDCVAINAVSLSHERTISFSNATKQEASFMFLMLRKEHLIRYKFENEAKNEFIAFCRTNYAYNDEQVQAVDDFEKNYRPQKALWWLTQSRFISRILNRAEYTKEFDIIYKISFFLKHVQTQLTIRHNNTLGQMQNILIVYRGKTMSNDEFEKLLKSNCGGLLSFANFLEANIDKDVALDFVRRRRIMHHELTAIIFEIHIEPTVYSTKSPFTLLDDESKKGVVCFSRSTVFRIQSITQAMDCSALWTVKLTLVSDNDEQLMRLMKLIENNDVLANPLPYMGTLLKLMDEYPRIEKFYLALLSDTSVLNQPSRLGRVHTGLAASYKYRKEYAKALEHFRKSLEISLSYLPPEHSDLVPLYDSIGDVQRELGNYVQAVDNYERAVTLLENNRQMSNDSLIESLHKRIISTQKLLEDKQ